MAEQGRAASTRGEENQTVATPAAEMRGASVAASDRSWFSRVFLSVVRFHHTPWRDLLRGRLTNRLDWRSRVGSAGLPAELADRVEEVVRRTRLWRLEKADVAAELVAHFQDGLAAGRSPAVLLADFGDARDAAKLIRRAKKRHRPLAWRAWVRLNQGLGLALAAMIVVYAVLAIRYFSGRPNIEHDYVADLNAAARAVPEAERGWPRYREGLLALEGAAPWEDPTWPNWPESTEAVGRAVAPYLQANRAAVELIRQGAANPGLGYLVGPGIHPEDAALFPDMAEDDIATPPGVIPAMLYVLTPHIGALHRAALVLRFDVDAAAWADDGERVHVGLVALLGIADHMRETPGVLPDYSSLAVFAMACDRVSATLAWKRELLTAAQLQELAHRLAARVDDRLSVRYRVEQWWFEDLLQRLYTDDGQGGGRLAPGGLRSLEPTAQDYGAVPSGGRDLAIPILGPIAMALWADRAAMSVEYEKRLMRGQALAAVPLWERDETSVEGEEADDFGPIAWLFLSHGLVETLAPTWERAGIGEQAAMQRRDAALAAIALELWRREHGEYPAELAALVPQYLPAVPLDRYTGGPLGYVVRDGRPILYCVGIDHDDDGGRPPSGETDTYRVKGYRVHQWKSRAWVENAKAQAPHDADPNDDIWLDIPRIEDGDLLLHPPLGG